MQCNASNVTNHKKDYKIAKLQDYTKELLVLCQEHDKIFYKPHPYAPKAHKIQEEVFLKEIACNKEVSLVSDNLYEIFTLPYKMHFVGLSSGALFEAKYFNKESTILMNSPYKEDIELDKPLYINIDAANFFSPCFWQVCLEEFMPIQKDFSSYSYKYPDMLRNHHSISWDYGKLMGIHTRMFREMYTINKQNNLDRPLHINPFMYWLSLVISDWKRYLFKK